MKAISSRNVLDKISELAARAKETPNNEQQLGYIVAIKTLCELLEQESDKEADFRMSETAALIVSPGDAIQSKGKVPMDDANGTSLLDF